MEIGLAKSGADHPDVAAININMASVYDNQCDYTKALELFEKSLENNMVRLGSDHLNTKNTTRMDRNCKKPRFR